MHDLTATYILRAPAAPVRLLTEEFAAAYIGISVGKFRQRCPVRPVDLGRGARRFDVRDLDAWVDRLKSGDTMDSSIARLR